MGLFAQQFGPVYMVDQFSGSTFDAQLANCIAKITTTNGGTCDARNYTATQTFGSPLTISQSNITIWLPCASMTMGTANNWTIAPSTRNVNIRGCAFQGGAASGYGGSAFQYTGSGAAFVVGNSSADTPGFHMDNVLIDLSGTSYATRAIQLTRAQEVDIRSVYITANGQTNQIGLYLDGTGNYVGGTFDSIHIANIGTGLYMTGHQSGSVVDDYANASTFIRLHIDCATSGGNPIGGTFGINNLGSDGNTFMGGDVESCDTALHLGPNATSNVFTGLRNENSNMQYIADSGSSFNNVIPATTIYTGKITDNGSRNSFWDAFHFAHNGTKGDWYASQVDSTVVNHMRLGIGLGNIRGMQWESQIDQGTSGSVYNWLWGMGDGAGNGTTWSFQDLINNVNRLVLTQGNTNNQSALNATGTAFVCFNCSTNAGTGGIVVSSGGASPTGVASISGTGNASFNGTLAALGTGTFGGNVKIQNNADAEIDLILQSGLTSVQKEAITFKDYNGTSQWYWVKDNNDNIALNSAVGTLDAIKAYQSTNSGDLYLNAASTSGHIRLNYETNSGAETDIYNGGSTSANMIVTFLSPTAIKFPGLLSTSQSSMPRIDTSGYISNSNVGLLTGTVAVSGACTSPAIYFNTNGTNGGNNNMYVCTGGTWAVVK
jgi:hypothetical protein